MIVINKYPLKRFKHVGSVSSIQVVRLENGMRSKQLTTIFNFVYAELNLNVNEQINLTPNTTTNVVIATYDPRFLHNDKINEYQIVLEDNQKYTIINKQHSDLYIHNPTLLTLQKKGGV